MPFSGEIFLRNLDHGKHYLQVPQEGGGAGAERGVDGVAKGEGELRTVYRQSGGLIEEMLRSKRDVPTWAAIIRARGMRLSRHLWGGAVDVRTRDLSSEGLRKLKEVVKATGGRAYLEYDGGNRSNRFGGRSRR